MKLIVQKVGTYHTLNNEKILITPNESVEIEKISKIKW